MAETPRLAFEMPVCVCVWGGGSDVSVYVRVCEFRFVMRPKDSIKLISFFGCWERKGVETRRPKTLN